ncbi:lipopolysaccharide transport system ATP-binding protein [Rhodanobacter sp. K2T2]|uniref:ABC transporter ATP-binding protein n=1 Tax=Rhodanobacter sp. K2T2 TaxID=2723085 RepID=UPI0015C745C4|nr:ABC transporter ATP-binding protein [Rhodanobacter sp. K2T2]NYE30216.1 lipopolysaccharide transport system ATP-binding protein [Rhodanobacter sp. K2T2]
MLSELAIDVRSLSKSFSIYESPAHRLWQMLFRGHRKFFREHVVLKGISFQVRRGETVALIGRNGAGKSTLLQILCGTLDASGGHCIVNGRVAALLELGAGFNPEFTGRENVYMSGQILGLSDEELDSRYEKIVAFADIGDYVDQPVKTYSSGMFMRLAFAVIAHVDAEVLVIDEALAVGDAYFVQKCMRFLQTFKASGGTLLFVSHDTTTVTSLCDRAIWLQDGAVRLDADPKQVTEAYLADMYRRAQGADELDSPIYQASNAIAHHNEDFIDARRDLVLHSNIRNDIEVRPFDIFAEGFGKGGAAIKSVKLMNEHGSPLSWCVGGERVDLIINVLANEPISSLIVGFLVRNKQGLSLFGDNTYLSYLNNPIALAPGEECCASFEFRMPVLPGGDYSISVAVSDGTQNSHVVHQWKHDAIILSSHSSQVSTGLIGIPMRSVRLVAPSKI